MRRVRILTTTLALLALGAIPAAAAAAPHLGTPEVITSLSGEANLLAASSAPGHGDAYAVFWRKIGRNVYSVVYRDGAGRAHRFDLRTPRGTHPQAIRLVALEDGAGMAIWDDARSRSILARAWTREGRLGATQIVLAGVTTTRSSENDGPQWRLRADGRGTVVVATTGLPPGDMGRVYAAVRDPGAPFGPQQELTRPPQPQVYQRQLRVSPIAADGSVAVAWGPENGEGPGAVAIRAGRAARFRRARGAALRRRRPAPHADEPHGARRRRHADHDLGEARATVPVHPPPGVSLGRRQARARLPDLRL